jgi:sarcosine oxidase subunit gamma
MHPATLACAWNLQGDPARASIVAAVQRLLGVALPVIPNTARRAESLLALWTGPRSWLLIESGSSVGPAALLDFDAKRDALNAAGGALFDISASRIAFTLRGARAGSVLASSCPLDFDSRVFLPGNCAQSVFGRSSALYYRHEATPGFTIMVSRSLAADVWRALCITAASDGYDVGLPAAFDAA